MAQNTGKGPFGQNIDILRFFFFFFFLDRVIYEYFLFDEIILSFKWYMPGLLCTIPLTSSLTE